MMYNIREFLVESAKSRRIFPRHEIRTKTDKILKMEVFQVLDENREMPCTPAASLTVDCAA